MIPWVAIPFSFAVVSSAEAVTVNFGSPGETPSYNTRLNNVASIQVPGDLNNVINELNVSIESLVICISDPIICSTPDNQLTQNKVLETYNIDFLFGSFNSIFGPGATNNAGCVEQDPDTPMFIAPVNRLCFWENTTKAELAQTAIDSAINNQSGNPIANIAAPRVPQITFPPFPPTPPNIQDLVNYPAQNEYLIPTGFDNDPNLSYLRSSNETNNTWERNTTPDLELTIPRMYALFEFQGSETITPPDPPNPPGVPESSSAIAVILTGVSILLTKGKKN